MEREDVFIDYRQTFCRVRIAARPDTAEAFMVFINREIDVLRSIDRSTVCSSVVLPQPISPVMTVKPAWPSMPYRRWLSASR